MTSATIVLTWTGIFFCIANSAIFSGLNLALFGVSRLRLEVAAASGSREAEIVLGLRKDSHFLLTTVLWGNVSVNCLLTLLSESVMVGVAAFAFSTFVITFLGEIAPQAYFSRNALRMASVLAPVLKIYQTVLWPVAKPTARVLDWWLGVEEIAYFLERDLREVIKRHVESERSDIERLEGIGALNFLSLDDLTVSQEGEAVDPESVITLPVKDQRPAFPEFERVPADPFLRSIDRSGKKWVIIADPEGVPRVVLDADGFLRGALLSTNGFNPYLYCHRPIVVSDHDTRLADPISRLKVSAQSSEDDVVDHDLILVWGNARRVITGADILGRLLRGVVTRAGVTAADPYH